MTLLKHQRPFEEFQDSEQQRATTNVKKHKSRSKRTEDEARLTNAIFTDALNDDDWEILRRYRDLLQPLMEATMDLQGRAGDGKSACLTHVILDIECLVEHLTEAYQKHQHASADVIEGQWHFAAQIKLALDKAEEYYSKLDDSPAYTAAVILHPRYNVKYLETQWDKKPGWVTDARKAAKSLWTSQYKKQPVSEAISPVKTIMPHREPNKIQAYRQAGIKKVMEQNHKQAVTDEFERYCTQDQVNTDAPIQWWQTTGSLLYPKLAQMAIDILSIPAMSDEPERIFSRLGVMITKRRNRLEHSIIQATTCLHSWDKAGLIDLRDAPTTQCT